MKVVHFLFRNILVYGYLKETRVMLWLVEATMDKQSTVRHTRAS